MENQSRFDPQTGVEGGPTPGASGAPRPSDGAGASPPRVKADVGKRIIAAIIDGVLAGIVGLIPIVGALVGAAYMLFRDGLDIDFMDRRSIGKKLLKLRPVTLDGAPMDLVASAKRNWMFALGAIGAIPVIGWLLIIPIAFIAFGIAVVELVLVLTDAQGRRIGDKIANTMVIDAPE